jgi:hypothetical protein
LAASVRSVDAKLAAAILESKDWRSSYPAWQIEVLRQGCLNEEAAFEIASAGLDFCYRNFRFVRDGRQETLYAALGVFTPPPGSVETITFKGSTTSSGSFSTLPYKGALRAWWGVCSSIAVICRADLHVYMRVCIQASAWTLPPRRKHGD